MSRRTKSYAAADVADADGVKTSFATATDAVALTAADWNGVAIAVTTGILNPARTITVTLSNNANQFSTEPIVLTGTRNGVVVTASLTPANDDGNVTLATSQPFDTLTGVALPAMGGTGGTITIGVRDICAPKGDVFSGVELAAAGVLNVSYGGTDTTPEFTDAIAVGAAQVGFRKDVQPTRILTSPSLTAPTTVGLTVYIG